MFGGCFNFKGSVAKPLYDVCFHEDTQKTGTVSEAWKQLCEGI